MNSVPPVTELMKDVYLINEFDGTNCYLVTGSDHALLIDCGTGFCDIRSAVENVTNLPVVLVATHGHVDHIGGAGQFEEMYIHRADTALINRIQKSVPARRIFTAGNEAVKRNGFGAKNVKKDEYKTKWIPIDGGHVFDLGNKEIIAVHTPGHTKGSIALVDKKDRAVFSGDNVCDALWLHLPGRTSVEEWLPSAEWLLEASRENKVYWGHRVPMLTSEYISKVVGWGREILQMHTKNSLLPVTAQYPEQIDGILYKTNTVFKK